MNDWIGKFSKRELEIIEELIKGKNNNQMAEILNISENTVKTHIKHIYRKMDVNNRTALSYKLMQSKN